ncbi:hypothetical protein BDP27DRAFT_1430278 [Rhodocollybia butyracea]|uniref:Uncharacterized protein n=1 Tax=Rhodocollybia butyracea TaxID=206335 RepID=A0A9P5PBR7_9AGAR|nr:hypothetical protein BDP27DRAFT_1430278 [Rhodocollybia butyracea]
MAILNHLQSESTNDLLQPAPHLVAPKKICKSRLRSHTHSKPQNSHSIPKPSSNLFLTPSELSNGNQLHYDPWTVTDNMVPEGKRLDFGKGHNKYLPAVFEVPSHILVGADLKDIIQRTLIIPWPAGNQAYNKFFFNYVKENLGVPQGPNEKMAALGLGELVAGDMAFTMRLLARVPSAPTIRFDLRNATKGQLRSKVLNAILGNVRGPLCQEEQEHLEYQQKLTTTRAAVNAFRTRNAKDYRILHDTAEPHNVPCVGCEENVCFQAVQMNLATPQVHHCVNDLSKQLGFFGGMHFDQGDSEGGFTTMFSLPDLPNDSGWGGGQFHLVELGLYVRLDKPVVLSFSGLRLHGGTPPLAPVGMNIAWHPSMGISLGYAPRLFESKTRLEAHY